FHTVVLTSTVMPGATGGAVRDCLEQGSERRCGEDFGLCYSPEFIALGSVIHDMLHPDFILIGESDARAGDALTAVYHRLCVSDPPIHRSNFVNAELAKIAVNTYVTTKISYANMLSDVCERLPGADVDVVTAALGLDSRIGRKYLKGATGYGGPCFPRDNVAFARLARRLGAAPLLAEATDAVNREQTGRLSRLVAAHAPAGATIAILGLAYKPGTDVVTESQGVALAQTLSDAGYRVVAYDPAAMDNARAILGQTVAFAPSVHACVADADAVVITTPAEEFKALTLTDSGNDLTIIDCWRILAGSPLPERTTYISLGVGPTMAATEGRERL
nr:nucleotide sugar dehydrogenase [Armatimonadota bacterium]